MHRCAITLAALVSLSAATATDVRLSDGTVLGDAVVVSRTATAITLRHKAGLGTYAISQLSHEARMALAPQPNAEHNQPRLSDTEVQAQRRYGAPTMTTRQQIGGEEITIRGYLKPPFMIWLYHIRDEAASSGIKYAQMDPAYEHTVNLDPMSLNALLAVNVRTGKWEAVDLSNMTNAFEVLGRQAVYEKEHYQYFVNVADQLFGTYDKDDKTLFLTTIRFHELRGKSAKATDGL